MTASRHHQHKVGSVDDNNISEDDEELEHTVPEKLRKFHTDEERELLPVKTPQGGLIRRYKSKEDIKQEEEDEIKEEEKEDRKPDPTMTKEDIYSELSVQELLVKQRELLEEAKLRISAASESLINDPQENFLKLREIYRLATGEDDEVHSLVKEVVQKLAIASLVEVFIAILPGYHIRPLTEEEEKQKMKAETKRLIQYEHTLLDVYQKFLQVLAKQALKLVKSTEPAFSNKFSILSVRCLCKLLEKAGHFNDADQIMSCLVRLVISSMSKSVLNEICQTISTSFREDVLLRTSLHGAKAIAEMVNAKKSSVAPQLLTTLLSLNIKEVDKGYSGDGSKRRNSKKIKQKYELGPKRESRGVKKKNKKQRKLDAPLIQAQEAQELSTKLKTATETMKYVFVTYFRILKRMPTTSLLSPVLEGLAKFAHLINVEFFEDLVRCLSELVDQKHLKVSESLQCIKTVCVVLSGEGQALNIDPLRFYNTLYALLPSLVFQEPKALLTQVELIADCLDMLIIKRRRMISLKRVAAFVKRILLVAILLPLRQCISLLAMVRTIFVVHSGLKSLVDKSQEEAVANGIFRPDAQDPDCSNSLCTDFIPELNLLAKHPHPVESAFARNILNQIPSSGVFRLKAQWTNIWLNSDELSTPNPDGGGAKEESIFKSRVQKFCAVKKISLNSKNVCSTLCLYLSVAK